MKHYLSTFTNKARRLLGTSLLATMVAVMPAMAQTDTYGLPTNIQDGNILHCFDWKMSDVKSAMANIAASGFGAVQISPLQRTVSASDAWYDAYRPYDFTFKQSVFGSQADLTSLCAEADKYGVKVIVDVVFNHVDNSGYHDTWWDSNSRLRSSTTGCNYNNRNSITHDRMGDYPDVNSESSEVAARAKAYIELLKSCGVDGIRFDAAKHIALPSESCDFWSTVTSVSDLYYYGEILDNPGGSNKDALMKEYADLMSVTDNGYGNGARNADGTPSSYAGWGAGTISQSKLVYWGESHDTYANSGGESQNVSQAVVDRAYAIVACRNEATALYLSRPSSTSNIKCGQKGSTHFTEKCVAEVNKFRNAMVGKADYYTVSGGVACVTRQDGGAVIVKKGGAGSVSIANGGGYVPAGTYTDQVSGNTFTVTTTTISGTVGSSGIAVIYDAPSSPTPTPSTDPTDASYCYFNNTAGWSTVYVWAWNESENCTAAGNWHGDEMTLGSDGYYKWTAPSGKVPTKIIFNDGDNTQTAASGFTFVNGKLYDVDGNTTDYTEPSEDPETDQYPSSIYLIGTVNSWNCATAIEAKGKKGVYTWQSVVLPDAGGTDAGKTFFSFNTVLGSSWNEVNNADRYGAATTNTPISVGTPATVSLYAVGVNASACKSWQATPGTYTLTLDLTANTVAISTGTPALVRNVRLTTDDAAPIYNILGQRVGSSYRGIVIQGGRKFIKK